MSTKLFEDCCGLFISFLHHLLADKTTTTTTTKQKQNKKTHTHTHEKWTFIKQYKRVDDSLCTCVERSSFVILTFFNFDCNVLTVELKKWRESV